MSRQSLAVKYRPKKFEDVVEQTVPKAILTEQLKNKSFRNCLLFCGGAGTGKAQPLYSKVLTPDGFVTMGEIHVGFDVITGKGNIAKVIEVYPQGFRDVYRITLGGTAVGLSLDGSDPTFSEVSYTIDVADNHLNVICVNEEERIVTTTELIDIFKENKHIFMYRFESLIPTKIKCSITKIDYIGSLECQCIYVDAPEHTYITDNYIITHNTTSARIFGKEVNDFKGHIIEIDAASHNGVDDARYIIEEARTQSLDSEYKVFICDECHMFSTQAWNALLKLVEEPPKKSLLVFCTTDPQKIPATILSRVQRFNFQKISFEGILDRLKFIIESENSEIQNEVSNENSTESSNYITYEESALEFITKQADGGMRDAITLLDKCISYNTDLTLSNVLEALGSVNYDTMFTLTTALLVMDAKTTLETIEEIHKSGMDLKQFMKQYNYFVLDLCKYGYFYNFDHLQMPKIYDDKMKSFVKEDFLFFKQLLDTVIDLNKDIKNETSPKPIIESRLLLLCMEEG